MSNQNVDAKNPLVNAAFAYAPFEKTMTEEQLITCGRLRLAFTSGGEWRSRQITADLQFILQALPNEHKITDLQLRAELDLVRNKVNEIISKIQ